MAPHFRDFRSRSMDGISDRVQAVLVAVRTTGTPRRRSWRPSVLSLSPERKTGPPPGRGPGLIAILAVIEYIRGLPREFGLLAFERDTDLVSVVGNSAAKKLNLAIILTGHWILMISASPAPA